MQGFVHELKQIQTESAQGMHQILKLSNKMDEEGYEENKMIAKFKADIKQSIKDIKQLKNETGKVVAQMVKEDTYTSAQEKVF